MASFFFPDFSRLPISSGHFTKYSDKFSTYTPETGKERENGRQYTIERARELNAACTLPTLLGVGFPKDDESWTLECELYDEDKNHNALMRQNIT